MDDPEPPDVEDPLDVLDAITLAHALDQLTADISPRPGLADRVVGDADHVRLRLKGNNPIGNERHGGGHRPR